VIDHKKALTSPHSEKERLFVTDHTSLILYPPVYKKKMHPLQTAMRFSDYPGGTRYLSRKDSKAGKRQCKDDDCGNDAVVTKKLPAARL
jgi:hypothetical protein